MFCRSYRNLTILLTPPQPRRAAYKAYVLIKRLHASAASAVSQVYCPTKRQPSHRHWNGIRRVLHSADRNTESTTGRQQYSAKDKDSR